MKTKRSKITLITLLAVSILSVVFSGDVPQVRAQSTRVWSDPVNLSKSGGALNPMLVIGPNGTIHVIWVDEFDGYKYAMSVDGVNWTTPATIKFPFSFKADPPKFRTTTNGLIHVFWKNDKNILYYAQTRQEDFGNPGLWKAIIQLGEFVADYDVQVDPSGGLHVSFIKNMGSDSDPTGVYYRNSANSGLSWSSPNILFKSQYFRSLAPKDTRVRLAVSKNTDEKNVFAVWDDRSQKRIFMAISSDGGAGWVSGREIVAPLASLGFKTPYNADIEVLENQVLVTWSVGEPGVRCTPYSWSSSDGGETWSEPVKVLADSAQCPERSEFISTDQAYSLSLFSSPEELLISAWNGSTWSNPEIQARSSLVTNPITLDSVVLGCEQAAAYNAQLFVVGCDQAGGDIWFITRQLDTLESRFPLPFAWGGDTEITTAPGTISSLSFGADDAGNAHAFWLQPLSPATGASGSQIEYARWDGTVWTEPVAIISELDDLPANLSLQMNNRQQRLMLSWVNLRTGELLFTSVNSERAYSPLEWLQPVVVLSSSKLTSSPHMLVDAAGRIVIAYAVTLNEGRGIYVIQSADSGGTWSQPIKVFDAEIAGWEMADQPKLAVTEDGRLHAQFVQYSLFGSRQQSTGLYYSQSSDGGLTWTTPEVVSQQPVYWSEFVSYKGALHRFWLGTNISVNSTFHQISPDGGITWSSPRRIPNDGGVLSAPAVSLDSTGKIHLLQITQEDVQIFQEWEWGNGRWQLIETRELGIPKQDSRIGLAGSITAPGIIHAIVQLENPSGNGMETTLLNISRPLELDESEKVFFSASISTPGVVSFPTATPAPNVIPTQTFSLADVDDVQPKMNKNIVGLILVAVFIFLVIIVVRSRKVER